MENYFLRAQSGPIQTFDKGSKPAIAQTTIKNPIFCRGVGLHSGKDITLKLLPSKEESGIQFQRLDLKHSLPFRLTPQSVIGTKLSTVIASPDFPEARIATIEHLMAALHALEIDNILIQVDGPEIPILDGAALNFLFLLNCAGRQNLKAPRHFIKILHPLMIKGENGSYAAFKPRKNREFKLKIGIKFDNDLIGQQYIKFILQKETFTQEIAFARTFVDFKDIEALKKQGLALGGSLKNALVFKDKTILNPGGLHTQDEFVRHKLLDAIGDSYCFGYQIIGKFEGFKSGHTLNNRLLKALATHKETWRLISE
ncbi:UDP-3-O-[3-hydroxymyristoyl] N-acetylglucosamine deacetylase [Aristophania vespae]|uniref:UDP-3-O-acyl-N-acetylglucosamine deacetylase n=1 Tax=Aristophania vespae TaxID=2697033 RepID=A0A6P1NEA1_9PROT|nr:UDP-3-O-acyl-N-acetylglucosamine deacetylase [Aristophania vespae]QHI95753.1 UDP-3-O-[3-hydroxymyristoyl] N-acetylglucosamine deacetylase [Aristophania vespae]UMM63453.1 UDP-3-O-acyl-N-acetylglucosamine deacetylase [Aristophania vespae]